MKGRQTQDLMNCDTRYYVVVSVIRLKGISHALEIMFFLFFFLTIYFVTFLPCWGVEIVNGIWRQLSPE